MSTAKKLEEEIASYLTRLNENQKKAVLTVVKTFAEEEDYDHWSDPAFVQEMETRYHDMKTGKVRGITMDEMNEHLEQLKTGRKKRNQSGSERHIKEPASDEIKSLILREEGEKKPYKTKKRK